MARKLTSKQRKARKRASYIRSEYYKNFDALDYLRNFVKVKDIQIPNKITNASLKAIRKEYKKAKARAKAYKERGVYTNISTGEDFIKLPSKEEMASRTRKAYGQGYRKYRAEPEQAPADFDPNAQYIDELKEKIRAIEAQEKIDEYKQKIGDVTYLEETVGYNRKKKETFDARTLPKFEKAKQAWENMIDLAVEKFGVERAAQAFAQSPHMQKIDDLSKKYAYEIIDEINDNVLPWMVAGIAYEVSHL